MREAIPRKLWLGNAKDARDLRRLHDLGVAAVVDLAVEELPPQVSRDLIYCRFPLVDGVGNPRRVLSAAVETTASFIRNHIPTLVSCGAGLSRSPAVVAAALAIVTGGDPDSCLRSLMAGYPHDLSPSLWNDVKTVYQELTG